MSSGPTTPEVRDRAQRGAITVQRHHIQGISRIPLDAIKLTNRQMRDRFAVYETAGVHFNSVRVVACHSYIRACDDPFGDNAPYSSITRERDIPPTVKIVSISWGGGTPASRLGADLPFASIEGKSNEDTPRFLLPGVSLDEPWVRNRRAAIAANKVLFVSSYTLRNGVYSRNGTGCEDAPGDGLSEGCIWVHGGYGFPPTMTPDGRTVNNFGGNSANAPHLAAALASVLAVFPETSYQDLIRLAKACVIPTPPSLRGGVGLADFTCMTKTGDDGEWRAVTADEFAALLSPDRMNGIVFPGDARITGTFVGRNGKPVTLGTRSRGAFSFVAGIPSTSLNLASSDGAAGFFPIAADGEGHPSVGFGYMAGSGLFAAAAFGGRPGFFGLGKRYGYVNAAAVDVSAGHRNAYVRLSRQTSAAPYVRKVRGDALGVTATGTFEVGARTWLTLSAHMDRFLGGRAATAFGPVSIDASPWNGAARLFAERRIGRGGRGGAVTLSLDRLWPGRGRGETSVKAGYAVRF